MKSPQVVKVSRSVANFLGDPNRDRDWTIGLDSGVSLRVTLRDVYGTPQIVGFAIDPVDRSGRAPTVITGELIRRLPLGQIRQACLADGLEESDRGFFQTISERRGKGRTPLTDDVLQRVADTYRAAVRAGIPRQGAIKDAFGVELKTADKYIWRARDAGFLAWPARAGEQGAHSTVSPITRATASPKEVAS